MLTRSTISDSANTMPGLMKATEKHPHYRVNFVLFMYCSCGTGKPVCLRNIEVFVNQGVVGTD